MRSALIPCLLIVTALGARAGENSVSINSPGFSPSSMDGEGRLVEDWAAVAIRLAGDGIADGPVAVDAIRIDDCIPAARAVSQRGAVRLTCTAYRAPVFPSGVDVLTVRVEEARGEPADVTMTLDVPADVRIGSRTVKFGGRTVLTLPAQATRNQQLRDWGYCDEAAALPGWAKPQGECDSALANIRAGMGGVPIIYRFAVAEGGEATVVIGLCESHWAEPGRRPLECRVEGAPAQIVDPVGQWGQHKPGALTFRARDADGDGRLDVVVRCAATASDRNPILNAIWIFPSGEVPSPDKVLSGMLNAAALQYVDVGGQNDQSIYPPGKLEYRLALPAGGAEEFTFLVACPGSSAPIPDTSSWTPNRLRRAAREVWRAWPQR